jgi:hypothetical protein
MALQRRFNPFALFRYGVRGNSIDDMLKDRRGNWMKAALTLKTTHPSLYTAIFGKLREACANSSHLY